MSRLRASLGKGVPVRCPGKRWSAACPSANRRDVLERMAMVSFLLPAGSARRLGDAVSAGRRCGPARHGERRRPAGRTRTGPDSEHASRTPGGLPTAADRRVKADLGRTVRTARLGCAARSATPFVPQPRRRGPRGADGVGRGCVNLHSPGHHPQEGSWCRWPSRRRGRTAR
jgi:hypothetical protein